MPVTEFDSDFILRLFIFTFLSCNGVIRIDICSSILSFCFWTLAIHHSWNLWVIIIIILVHSWIIIVYGFLITLYFILYIHSPLLHKYDRSLKICNIITFNSVI